MTTTEPSRQATTSSPAPARITLFAGLVGVVTALVTLAVAEVVSLLLGGRGNPILSVGSLVIDLTPGGLKTLVIDVFGTADKIFLFVVLGLVVVALAVAVGIVQLRKPPYGITLLLVVGLIALVASVTRSEATAIDGAPVLIGVAAGVIVLRLLVRRLEAWESAAGARSAAGTSMRTPDATAISFGGAGQPRRQFLTTLIVAGVASAVVAAAARAMSAATTAANTVRESLRLPAAASPGPLIGTDATLDVDGISPFVTANADFYRIDTALQVPAIDSSSWTLKITGMVEEELEITFDELLALPLQERWITLTCVSNEVGGDLIGNALWLGYPIRELLARAKPDSGADMVLSTSQDGFTASTPLAVLTDENTDALLAVGMNGEPLPLEHGFPVRMVVPGLYGYVSATKWVTELKVTTFEQDEGYWTSRGWTARGPIKISSRIDTPSSRTPVSAGTVAIAGVAWAQHTGIAAVEVSIDGGQWRAATLATAVTADTWLQWSYAWEATSGDHEVRVRATDRDGTVQTASEAPPAPDGSTGLHTVTVSVD
ncbi:DMSO/TMAO reductase YedYZ molybdopterin-dependent catalytic subunit [Glaciihabitans tibetensis]|uniref:DMSO/TMAO reductase YedYZ molybdopterin-dependent catalytic subunit n=1 Tax=Glaciihabitans tibetensis TaxID=1266600 RepID=A0A2T0VAT1_9MICO|nr:molybdopterin-dependent oxidoreductase [Glaciihabitans tibetensis]PRY67309.1 DMSO/TMAO reductase YedYZ molybdopterin-dependent catalytic subunit [Glaciihabitans tibetensis]